MQQLKQKQDLDQESFWLSNKESILEIVYMLVCVFVCICVHNQKTIFFVSSFECTTFQ